MLQGKGFFIWKIRDCEGGDPSRIASLTRQAALTHVLIKIADGAFPYNLDRENNVDLVPPLVRALKNEGIQAWGWHFVYGDAPVAEARAGVQRVLALNLDGYVVDAEAPFKQPGKKEAARRFMIEVRAGLPDLPIALSSYRYPSYHPQLPWREFLEKCDLNMPQVYWQNAQNPGVQLNRTVQEFQALTPFRAIVPTGSAYSVGSWIPTPAQILEFLQTAQSLNLAAANFWEWSKARSPSLPGLWEAIRDYPWSGPEAPGDVTERYIAALNTHDPDEVLNLYSPSAAHVTSSHTIAGAQAIRAWYQSFLTGILPQANFTLTGFSGSGNSRHFTWTATSPQGVVPDGSDVLGLLDGKIVYHYTSFTVTPL